MTSRLGSHRAILAVRPGSRSRKTVAAPPASKSDSKSDKLGAKEKSTPAPSHASASSHASAPSYASVPAVIEPTLALKYSKADLMRILKIFLETKGQEPKAKVPHEQLLKVKVPDVYFGKSHINCYHFC